MVWSFSYGAFAIVEQAYLGEKHAIFFSACGETDSPPKKRHTKTGGGKPHRAYDWWCKNGIYGGNVRQRNISPPIFYALVPTFTKLPRMQFRSAGKTPAAMPSTHTVFFFFPRTFFGLTGPRRRRGQKDTPTFNHPWRGYDPANLLN